MAKIEQFRNRKIFDLSENDKEDIADIFKKFMEALNWRQRPNC